MPVVAGAGGIKMEIRKCWVLNHKVFVVVAVQSLSHIWLFATSWTAALQAPLSFTISQSLLKFMSIELMMASNHLILCRPLLLLRQSFPASGSFPVSQLFASGGQSVVWSFSFNISPSSEYAQSTSPDWKEQLESGLRFPLHLWRKRQNLEILFSLHI